jgi:hypothetical protein
MARQYIAAFVVAAGFVLIIVGLSHFLSAVIP